MDDLPESWRRAADAPLNSPKKKPPRGPIQPIYKLWPWGFASVLCPVAALACASFVAVLLGLPLANWLSGALFFAILGFGNALLIARAIEREGSHSSFATRAMMWGACCFWIFLIPGAAEVYLAFLAAFVAVRLVMRVGIFGVGFLSVVVVAAVLFLGALNAMLAGAVSALVNTEGTRLGFAFIGAVPLLHSLLTAATPAEKGPLGRLDATFAGVSASLIGLFAGLVVYRTSYFFQSLATPSILSFLDDETRFIAAAAGLACGNAVCIRQLFNSAYSARAEREAAIERITPRPIVSHVATQALQIAGVTPDDETDIDEAT